jgi:hypothetical protein
LKNLVARWKSLYLNVVEVEVGGEVGEEVEMSEV